MEDSVVETTPNQSSPKHVIYFVARKFADAQRMSSENQCNGTGRPELPRTKPNALHKKTAAWAAVGVLQSPKMSYISLRMYFIGSTQRPSRRTS